MSRLLRPAVAFAVLLAAAGVGAHAPVPVAIAELDKAIVEAPDDAMLYLQRAALHQELGHWKAALADLDRAADRDPGLTLVEVQRGRLLAGMGRTEEAEQVLSALLQKQPQDASAWIARARVRVVLGAHAGAVEDYSRAMLAMAEPERPEPDIYLERARCLDALGRWPEAVASLDAGYRHLGAPALLLVALELESREGAWEAALRRVDMIAATASRKERWLLRRGEIMEQLDQPSAARRAYGLALAALQTLPDSRRWTRNSVRLEQTIRAALERLAAGAETGQPQSRGGRE